MCFKQEHLKQARLRHWSLILIILSSLLVLFGQHPATQAAQTTGAQFQVKALPPQQQDNQNANYFKINLNQGQSAQLGVAVQNNSGKAQTFSVIPTVGTTNDQGAILYNDTSKVRDSSLKIDFTKIGPQSKTFKVGTGKTAIYRTSVVVPNKPFTGVILGGFYVYSPSINKALMKQSSSKKSMQIRNAYGFALGAEINVGNIATIEPNFKIQLVRPTVINQKGAVIGIIQNFHPMYIDQHRLQMVGKIYRRHGKKVLFHATVKSMDFAPNSHINLPVSWGNHQMEPGDYTMRVVATRGVKTDTDYKVWHLTRNFTITPNEARAANKNPNLKKSYLWLIILLIILLILLVTILLVYVYKKGKNNNPNHK